MSKIFDESRPCMTQIREMEVGDTLLFPNKKIIVIRANISTYAKALDRKWSMRSLENEPWFEITRVK